jgi:hypothetical protein
MSVQKSRKSGKKKKNKHSSLALFLCVYAQTKKEES